MYVIKAFLAGSKSFRVLLLLLIKTMFFGSYYPKCFFGNY